MVLMVHRRFPSGLGEIRIVVRRGLFFVVHERQFVAPGSYLPCDP